MAEIDTSSGGGGRHKGKVRSKKMSTKVDFTPMVDLAFLLISFFMLTTSLSKPVAMQLAVPKPNDNPAEKPPEVKASQVLNIILGKDDIVWYYEGLELNELQKTDYSSKGIREVVLTKRNKVGQMFGDKDKTICLIKMTEKSNYKNMVDVLDEMDITANKIFAIQPILPDELKKVEEQEALIPSPTTPAAQ